VTSYRFPAKKNIVPYKRMMSQIKLSEKSLARNSFLVYENKTLDMENHAAPLLTHGKHSRLMAFVPICGL
jgi:hypothetical protein